MLYLEYADYVKMGGTLSETEFTRFLYQATNKVNLLTRNRVHYDFEKGVLITYSDELKALMFELIGLSNDIYLNNKVGQIQSESNEGMSKSFKVVNTVELEAKIPDLVFEYLGNHKNSLGKYLVQMGVY